MDVKSGVVILALFALLVRAQQLGESKVVGGGELTNEQHLPYSVAMTVRNRNITSLICGGSLINSKTVLTAAHCVDYVLEKGLLSVLRLTVGTNDWRSGGQSYEVSHNATHPRYFDSPNRDLDLLYDMSLLFTPITIILSDLVQPIPLDFDYVGAGVTCRLAGWGLTKTGGNVPDVINQLTVTTIEENSCVEKAKQASKDFNIEAGAVDPKVEICTFHLPNPVDHGACNGDSGSALVRIDRGTQIGIVSWGFPCARGAPDMYARISAFKEFITQHIEGNLYRPSSTNRKQ